MHLLSQFSRSIVSDYCDPVDCSTPGLPVHHQLPEFTQTYVHWVSDAIQPMLAVVVQSLSCIQLFVTPWTAAYQASLSITNSPSLLNLMSIESVIPSNHLILHHLFLLPPSIFPSIRVFTSGGQSIGASTSASVFLMNIQDWFPLQLTGFISLQFKGLSRVFSNTTVQKHQFFGFQLSLWSNSHICTWLLEKPYLWLDGPLLAK